MNDYVCGPPPAGADKDSYELRKCARLVLDDGRIVDSGIDIAYQEGPPGDGSWPGAELRCARTAGDMAWTCRERRLGSQT